MKNDRRIVRGVSVPTSYRQPLLAHITPFLECLRHVRDPVALRRVRWTPFAAGTAAVLMAMDHHVTLRAACGDAFKCMKNDFCGRRRPGNTYNGLVKALERQADAIVPIVKAGLRDEMRRRLPRIAKTAGWHLFGVDGSKDELPRTRDHERTFGVADNGVFPQAFITAVVELDTGLAWDWRIGRADASERQHLAEMIPDLPTEALMLADGAFVGYPTWSKLNAAGRSFLIRVGGNVHLIEKLWPDVKVRVEDRTVWVWPKNVRGDAPPLRLRLIRVGRGEKAVHLLTNVLDEKRLSKQDAGKIYRKRWGVEIFYRTLKRTFDYVKARCKASRRVRIELDWAMIAMAISTLIGVDALTRRCIQPNRLSPAQLLEALRAALHQETLQSARTVLRKFRQRLGTCVNDTYQRKRSKQSRVLRHTKSTPDHHVLKPPNIRNATPDEKANARKWPHHKAA